MTAAAPPTSWQSATVTRVVPETARAKTFTLRLERPTPLRAGQHFVVRLTAPDGYTASRSYSVASAPSPAAVSETIDQTVERLDDGEVSTYLHDVVEIGDELEVRGPIGNWFVWDGTDPVVLVGGGSGIVPLMSMRRFALQIGRPELVRMVVSVRTPDELYYAAELSGTATTIVYTRAAPPGADRPPGRLRRDDLGEVAHGFARAFICGSSGFADHAGTLLMEAGMASTAIRIERFGPTT